MLLAFFQERIINRFDYFFIMSGLRSRTTSLRPLIQSSQSKASARLRIKGAALFRKYFAVPEVRKEILSLRSRHKIWRAARQERLQDLSKRLAGVSFSPNSELGKFFKDFQLRRTLRTTDEQIGVTPSINVAITAERELKNSSMKSSDKALAQLAIDVFKLRETIRQADAELPQREMQAIDNYSRSQLVR